MGTQETPALRFTGFEDNWGVGELASVASIVGGGTPSTINPEYWDGEINWYSPTEIGNETYAKSSARKITELGLAKSSASLLPAHKTILFTSRASIGKVAILTEQACTNQGFQSMVTGENTDTYFLYAMCNEIAKQALRIASGSTFLEISGKALGQIAVKLPSLKEQEAIGAYFRELDALIEAEVAKLEKLRALKQTMLVKMFPQGDALVPEIRFTGFEDNWGVGELASVASIVGGGTPSTINPEYWDGEINWYSPTEIGNETYAKSSARKITELGLAKSSASLLPAHKTILFTSRASIGKVAILTEQACTNQGFQSMVTGENTDTYFLYAMCNEIAKQALRIASGSTFLEISGKALGQIAVKLPSLKEQEAIGAYFRELDALIEAEVAKLEKLRQLKSAFLNRMFV